jgi:transposase InsO family protein
MRFELRKAVEKYNTFRPHHALKGKTPMEYLRITQAEAA